MPTPLTTLASVKEWLVIPPANVAADALLSRLITAASGFIESYCSRTFALTAYSKAFNGNNGTMLVVPDYPLVSVASLSVDGSGIPAAANPIQQGYAFDAKCIYLRGYIFSRGFQNVRASYSAGYAMVPSDLEQAAIELISLRYKERDRIGHSSKAIQGEVTAFTVTDMPPQVRTLLGAYMRVIPA